MKSPRSFNYLRQVLTRALNYFGRIGRTIISPPSVDEQDENLIEVQSEQQDQDLLDDHLFLFDGKSTNHSNQINATIGKTTKRRNLDNFDFDQVKVNFEDSLDDTIDQLLENLNKKQRRTLKREFQRQGFQVNEQVRQTRHKFFSSNDDFIRDDLSDIQIKTEIHFDFKPTNFRDEFVRSNEISLFDLSVMFFRSGSADHLFTVSIGRSPKIRMFFVQFTDEFELRSTRIESNRNSLDNLSKCLRLVCFLSISSKPNSPRIRRSTKAEEQ